MQALEVGDLGLVAGLDQGVEARRDQLGAAAAEHGLLAEEVGLGLLGEGGLEAAGAQPADAARVGEREIVGVAGRVLVHGDQHRHALALLELAAHEVTGALGGDHRHVDRLRRHDLPEVDVEAVGEHQHRPVLEVGGDVVLVDDGLRLVGDQHHHGVGALRRLGGRQHLEAGLLGALRVGRAGHVADDHGHAGVAQVLGVGVPLTAERSASLS